MILIIENHNEICDVKLNKVTLKMRQKWDASPETTSKE